MTAPFLHVGMLQSGTVVERECPCGQAACGLVDSAQIANNCRIHGPDASVHLLQHHRPAECPALVRSAAA
jgi:hypothetical protein